VEECLGRLASLPATAVPADVVAILRDLAAACESASITALSGTATRAAASDGAGAAATVAPAASAPAATSNGDSDPTTHASVSDWTLEWDAAESDATPEAEARAASPSPSPDAARAAAARAVRSCADGSPPGVSWTAWSLPEISGLLAALVGIGYQAGPELRGLMDRATSLVAVADVDEAITALYWLTKLEMDAQDLAQRVAEQIPDVAALSPSVMHRLFWTLAARGATLPAATEGAVVEAAVAAGEALEGDDLAEVLWALGRYASPDPEAAGARLASLEAVVARRLDGMGPAALAMVAQAYGAVRPVPAAAMGRVAAHVRAGLPAFGFGDVLRVLYAFLAAGITDEALLRDVDAWLEERMARIPPQGLTAALWAYARMGHAPRPLLQLAADIACNRMGDFSPSQLSRLLWCYATLRVCHVDLMKAACESAQERIDTLDAKSLANILWACAALSWEHKPMLAAAARRAAALAEEMGTQAMSIAMWSFAKLRFYPEAFAAAAADAACTRLGAFEPQGLSMLLWAYATLGRHPGKLLWASAAEVARQLPQMEAQHVANVMWVYATLGHQPGKLMQEAGDEAASRLSEMKPQEVLMVAWSFAKLKYVHKGLLDAIRGDLAVRAGAFPAPELTGVMYAFARLKQSMPASTLRVCADVLTVSIADLPPHEVSVTVWSMAKMGHLHAPLMQAAAETVYARCQIFNPRQLTMLAWAFAALRYHPGRTLQAMQSVACQRLINARPFEVTTLLWAFSSLGEEPLDLLDAIASTPEVLQEFQSDLPPKNTVEGLWALAAAMQYDHPLYQVLARHAGRVPPKFVFPNELLSDLAQVCSLSTWECPTGEPPFPSKLKRLSLYLATKQAQDATESEASISEGGIGDVVQGIARVLEQVGLKHTCWPEVRKTPAPVHVLIEGPGGQQVAVVVEDEARDYTLGHAQRSGRAAVAQRVLWGAGMDVVPIRASEWRKVVASQEDPRDLLLGHLEDTAQVKAAATAAGLQVNKHS